MDVKGLLDQMRGAHYVNVLIRKSGRTQTHEADWLSAFLANPLKEVSLEDLQAELQNRLNSGNKMPPVHEASSFARYGIARQNLYHVALGASFGIGLFRPAAFIVTLAIVGFGYFLNKAEHHSAK